MLLDMPYILSHIFWHFARRCFFFFQDTKGFLFSLAFTEALGIHVWPVFSTAIYVPMVDLYSSATGGAGKSKMKNYCIFKGNLETPVLGGSIMGEDEKAPDRRGR